MPDCTSPQRFPLIDPRSGSAVNRSFALSAHFSSLFFQVSIHAPRLQRYRPPYWLCSHRLVPVDRLCLSFSTYPTLGVNDTDPRPGFSACPDFAVHGPSNLDARPRLGFRERKHVRTFPIITIGPACPTTWRQPIRSEIVFYGCSYAVRDLSPPLLPVSFRSGCRTVIVLCLRVCLVCLCSPCHHRFCSPTFVQAIEPWRYRTF